MAHRLIVRIHLDVHLLLGRGNMGNQGAEPALVSGPGARTLNDVEISKKVTTDSICDLRFAVYG